MVPRVSGAMGHIGISLNESMTEDDLCNRDFETIWIQNHRWEIASSQDSTRPLPQYGVRGPERGLIGLDSEVENRFLGLDIVAGSKFSKS